MPVRALRLRTPKQETEEEKPCQNPINARKGITTCGPRYRVGHLPGQNPINARKGITTGRWRRRDRGRHGEVRILLMPVRALRPTKQMLLAK